MLSNQQSDHLDSIIEAFGEAVIEKYSVGANEHGGFLGDKDAMWLLNEALNETIDQFTYLVTLKQKLSETQLSET